MNIGKLADLGDLYAEVNAAGTEITIRTVTVMYKTVPIGEHPRKETYVNCEGKDYVAVLEFVGGQDGHVEVRIHELLQQNDRVGMNKDVYRILSMGPPVPDAITNQPVSAPAPAAPVAPGLNVQAMMAKAGIPAPANVPVPAPVTSAPEPTEDKPVQLAMMTPEIPKVPTAPKAEPPTKMELREMELESKYPANVRSFAKHVSIEQAKELVNTSIEADKPFMEQVVAFQKDMIEIDPNKIDRMARILGTLPSACAAIYNPDEAAKHILLAWEV